MTQIVIDLGTYTLLVLVTGLALGTILGFAIGKFR